VVDPEEGRLAGGDVGPGRLADPAPIVAAAVAILGGAPTGDLEGLRVLVTAGGTREAIDPVRFIGNRSSGKMGTAVAVAAAARGATVTLVTTAALAAPGVEIVRVESAQDMHDAVLGRADTTDVVVMAAAVADFRPKAVADHKLKKAEGPPEIVLEPTPDILAALGAARRPGQVVVGFAAETRDVVAHATEKMRRKGIDLIVANDVSAADAGFEVDTNRAILLDRHGGVEESPLETKTALANRILDAIVRLRLR
jgi:phosphopantothenoylcysteine decarboxylase/phosphopantothenate--cysteine ligase